MQAASAAGATVTIQKGGQAQVVPLLDAYLGLTISLEPPVPQLLQSSSSGGSGTGSGTSGGSGGGSGGGSANLFTRSCYNAFDDKLETETLVDAVEDMM